MTFRRAPWLWLMVCAIAACKPTVGSSCEKGEARCIDPARQLVCQEGRFVEAPCRGPEGCSQEADRTLCDISGNRAGDPCSTDEQGAAVCKDGQTLLSCRGGQYVLVSCRGPNGCQREGDRSLCDQSVAGVGDRCDKAGSKACSTDSRQVLACKDGKMEPVIECRGQRGCAAVGGKLDCDLSIAQAGDPCEAKLEGHVACSPSGEKIVRCERGRFIVDETCKSGRRCVTEGTSTDCAKAH